MRREGYGKCSRSTFSGGSIGMTALLAYAAVSLPISSIEIGDRHRMSWVPRSTDWRAGSATAGGVRTHISLPAEPEQILDVLRRGLATPTATCACAPRRATHAVFLARARAVGDNGRV